MSQQEEKKEMTLESKEMFNAIYQLDKKMINNILFHFPVDLWVNILQYLPTFNILKCQQISLFFYLLINNNQHVYNVDNKQASLRINNYLKSFISNEESEYYHSLLFERIYFGIDVKNDVDNLPSWVNNYSDYLCPDSYRYHLNVQNRHSALEYNEMFNFNSNIYLNECFYLNFIHKYGSFIKSMEFNDCAFVTDLVMKYIKDYCPNLEELKINNCMRLSVDFFKLYLYEIDHPHFTTLKTITITNCKCLNDDRFMNYNFFFACFKNLKEITYDCYVPFPRFLDTYFTQILFQNFKFIKEYPFKSFVFDRKNKIKLESLEKEEEFKMLSYKEEHVYEEFYDIYYNFEKLFNFLNINSFYPNLTCLDLGKNLFTNLSFIDFLLHLNLFPNLQTLRLCFSSCLDKFSIFYNEYETSLSFRQQMLDKIKNHNYLLHLDLEMDYLRLNNVEGFTIIDLMKCFKNLETFNLKIKPEPNKKIKDEQTLEKEEQEIITTFIENHNKLKRLRLNYDYEWVNDISLFFTLIEDNCKDLTILELKGLFKKDKLDHYNLNDNNLFENLSQITIDLNYSELFTKTILEQIGKNEKIKILKLINGDLQNSDEIFYNAIKNVKVLTLLNFTMHNNSTNNNGQHNFGKIEKLNVINCKNTSNILNALPIMNDLNDIKLENCNHVNVKDLTTITTKENVYKIEKLIIEKTDIENVDEYFEHFSNLLLQHDKSALCILQITEPYLNPLPISKVIHKCYTHLSALDIKINGDWKELHKELLNCTALRFCDIRGGDLLPTECCEELLDNFPFKGYESIDLPFRIFNIRSKTKTCQRYFF
ncbi:hypothetical protein ABK040_004271 [Willaertia magna]